MQELEDALSRHLVFLQDLGAGDVDGIRSGVNWMRLKGQVEGVGERERIMSVFARPGTPTSRQWPRARSRSGAARAPPSANDRFIHLGEDAAVARVETFNGGQVSLRAVARPARSRRRPVRWRLFDHGGGEPGAAGAQPFTTRGDLHGRPQFLQRTVTSIVFIMKGTQQGNGDPARSAGPESPGVAQDRRGNPFFHPNRRQGETMNLGPLPRL